MNPIPALNDNIPLRIREGKFEQKRPAVDVVDVLQAVRQQGLEFRGQGVDVEVCKPLFGHCDTARKRVRLWWRD